MTVKVEARLNAATLKERKWMGRAFLTRPARGTFSLCLAIAVVSMLFTGCASIKGWRGEQHPPLPPDRDESERPFKSLDENIEKALTFGDSPIAMVLVIDREGNIQPLHRSQDKVFAARFPLEAGTIEWMEMMTIFKTTNPKVCRDPGNGKLMCVGFD
jgi:hypothetical protein